MAHVRFYVSSLYIDITKCETLVNNYHHHIKIGMSLFIYLDEVKN